MYGGPGFGGRPGGGPMGGGGPLQEPQWLGSLFLGLIFLSFIPGPWQIILGPIVGLINLFYMFKFALFFLAIVAVFGFSWWYDQTTQEGQCPRCLTYQRAPKNEPFQCLACGEELEVKGDAFVRYVKSGKVEGSAFDQLKDFAREAAARAAAEATPGSGAPSSRPSSGGPAGKPPRKGGDVIDVEVL